MNIRLVGIAGGSGAGKSTVCYRLVDDYPDQFEVINLDDYQKKKSEPDLPMAGDVINWDHPDIIDWGRLIADVKQLLSGEPVTLDVWSHRSNPEYTTHRKMIPRTIYPKPIILLEGYLALYSTELNRLYAKKFYLELDEQLRNERRGKNETIGDPDYIQNVLLPMHRQYVEPSKQNADEVINVSKVSVAQVAAIIRNAV